MSLVTENEPRRRAKALRQQPYYSRQQKPDQSIETNTAQFTEALLCERRIWDPPGLAARSWPGATGKRGPLGSACRVGASSRMGRSTGPTPPHRQTSRLKADASSAPTGLSHACRCRHPQADSPPTRPTSKCETHQRLCTPGETARISSRRQRTGARAPRTPQPKRASRRASSRVAQQAL